MKRVARLSRKEQALVLAALLVPLPLVALVVDSPVGPTFGTGLGSLATLHAGDERSRDAETARKSSHEQRRADGTLRVATRRGLVDPSSRPAALVAGRRSSASGAVERETAERFPRKSPADKAPGDESEPGDGGAAGAPRKEASTSAALEAESSENDAPGVTLTLSGQDSGATVRVDGGGIAIDTADSASSEHSGSVEASVTNTEGSSTGATVVAPGVTLP